MLAWCLTLGVILYYILYYYYIIIYYTIIYYTIILYYTIIIYYIIVHYYILYYTLLFFCSILPPLPILLSSFVPFPFFSSSHPFLSLLSQSQSISFPTLLIYSPRPQSLTPHVLSDGNVEWCSFISMCSCLKF